MRPADLRIFLPISLLLAPLSSGCFYPADRGKMMEERIDKLEATNRELEEALRRQKDRLEAQIPKLDEKVKEVENALSLLDKAARRTGADMGVQMEQLSQDLNGLRGQVEAYQHRIDELDAQLKALKDAPPKPAVADKGDKSDKGDKADNGEPKKKPVEAVEKPADKKAFAELVLEKLDSEPATGRELASEWIKKFGTAKDAASLAAKVHLALGKSYADQKDHRAALSEYQAVLKDFSKSEQAPEALLQASESFAALKMNEESRLALEELTNTYPKSDAAKTAKQKLEALKKSKGAKKPGKP
jgi:TolA-binding protein